MVTARRSLSLLRTRSEPAGPLRLLWLLWLVMVLFSLLYTHGLSGESAAGHVISGPPASAAVPAHGASTGHGKAEPAARSAGQGAAPDGHGNHETAHGAEECASGQPQNGADLPAPSTTPLDAVQMRNAHAWAAARPATNEPASPPSAAPAVLRI
ncbi:hypothetical protein GCM10010298_73180 [Streptomyces microflavus]|uniref:Uncharacterized protein n=1 Tax=Streptomyces microflavus TaxID=1919 RepID=A0A7J0CIJ8_STRMI|nr:hypothetical protein Smic_08870 [Streptomyces microflavus]GGX97133.1 hypothetical protein GCM10010298_73180 [Streptomyces microflavus]